jgi:cell division protein FtsN
MAESDWLLTGVIIGVLIGIPLGYIILQIFKQKEALVWVPQRTYTNMEDWEFVKDSRGRVTGVRVKREASAS